MIHKKYESNITDIESYIVLFFTLFCATNMRLPEGHVNYSIRDIAMYSATRAFNILKLGNHSFIQLDAGISDQLNMTLNAKLMLLKSQTNQVNLSEIADLCNVV